MFDLITYFSLNHFLYMLYMHAMIVAIDSEPKKQPLTGAGICFIT